MIAQDNARVLAREFHAKPIANKPHPFTGTENLQVDNFGIQKDVL